MTDRVRLDDLPIPDEVQVTGRWPDQLREFARVIGPRGALLLCDALGGQTIRIAAGHPNARIAAAIGPEGAAAMQEAFGLMVLQIPVARHALTEARRAGIIQAIREGQISIQQACSILGSSRTYISHLVNRPALDAPVAAPTLPAPRQTDLFADEA